MKSREVRLVRRPQGEPRASDFEIAIVDLPSEPPEGWLMIANSWLSVDPYMRGRMDDSDSYVPPFALGVAMDGAAVGTVIRSGDVTVPVGTEVAHQLGWREFAMVPADAVRPIDTEVAPAAAHLGAFGMPGLTAYVGLTRIGPVSKQDVVLISGAAGAVGLVAGCVARASGASRVVGIAGGPEKCRRLVQEFGFDAAVDRRAGNLLDQLTEAAPDGVDVYFDNVGGDHLQAALDLMRPHGRIVLCGAISEYNATTAPPGPNNLILAIKRRLTLRGYLVGDHLDLYEEYLQRATRWRLDGTLRDTHTEVVGLESAVDAFLTMMSGGNTGKMVVRL
jgi:NADPH-dependent curcumin reductase CurA